MARTTDLRDGPHEVVDAAEEHRDEQDRNDQMRFMILLVSAN